MIIDTDTGISQSEALACARQAVVDIGASGCAWRIVGSRLYGTARRTSDIDVLVVGEGGADEINATPANPLGLSGPACKRMPVYNKALVDVRWASPSLFASALADGRRWALEFCAASPVDAHPSTDPLSEFIFQYGARLVANEQALREYLDAHMPVIKADGPLPYSDHRRWWNIRGWHYKIGYYMLIECIFRRFAHVHSPSSLCGGRALRLHLHGIVPEMLRTASLGGFPRMAWHETYEYQRDMAIRACQCEKDAARPGDAEQAAEMLAGVAMALACQCDEVELASKVD